MAMAAVTLNCKSEQVRSMYKVNKYDGLNNGEAWLEPTIPSMYIYIDVQGLEGRITFLTKIVKEQRRM